jgi:hypothetical protein
VADTLGRVAAALFAASYFCARPETLRRLQMAAALPWVAYGLLTQARPVVAANLPLLSAAAWTARRAPAARGTGSGE